MNTIAPETFALVCYLVLMQNGEGIIDKHPDYITEKRHLLEAGYSAITALDIHNMRRVKGWCDAWKVEMPEAPRKYLEDAEKAMSALPINFQVML